MLVYGVLMIIAGVLILKKTVIIEKEEEAENDLEIKRALVRAAKKRKRIAKTLIVCGSILILLCVFLLLCL